MRKNDFVGSFALLKLASKRDKIKIPVWIILTSILTFFITAGNGSLSGTEMIQMAAVAIDNPGMRFMIAPTSHYMLDHLGAFVLFRMSFMISIAIALMNIQLMIRHTRQNEETGRTELIASTVTGKRASLTAATILGITSNLFIALGIAVAFIANGLDLKDSLIAGFSYGLYGILFLGIAAVFSELSASSKGASTYSTLALFILFTINAAGNIVDFGNHILTWLSPIGWIQHIRPFDKNFYFPFILLILASIIMFLLANYIVKHRDINTGLIPARSGRSEAKNWILNPFGFAVKLQRSLFIGWLLPITFLGFIFGSAGQNYADTMQETELLKSTFKNAENSFIFMMIGVVSMIICFYSLQSVLRIRSEETKGFAEPIIATPVKRKTYIISHIICGASGTSMILISFVIALLISLGIDDSFKYLLKYALQNSSAIILIFGICVAIYGIVPKFSVLLSGLVVATSTIAGPFFGTILQLPETLQTISPFSQFGFSYQSDNWPAALVFFIAGILLTFIGIISFKNRDLEIKL